MSGLFYGYKTSLAFRSDSYLKNNGSSPFVVVFFCERERRSQYSNERSGASVETARENRERGVGGSRASHARSRLAKLSPPDCPHDLFSCSLALSKVLAVIHYTNQS